MSAFGHKHIVGNFVWYKGYERLGCADVEIFLEERTCSLLYSFYRSARRLELNCLFGREKPGAGGGLDASLGSTSCIKK